jgi:cbb3-type cytochrome oxidase subunit 3
MNERDVAFYNYLIQFVGWVFIFSFTLFFLLIIYLILDPVLRGQFLTAIDIIIKEFK